MSDEENARIKLFNIIKEDTNTLQVKEVVDLFANLFVTYFDQTKTGRTIKNKVTEPEFVSFVTGFANSFLSSLYCSASNDENEFKERMELVEETNKDVLVSVGIKKNP